LAQGKIWKSYIGRGIFRTGTNGSKEGIHWWRLAVFIIAAIVLSQIFKQ
jgi:hypothetical protein